jgi:hypothetical protein
MASGRGLNTVGRSRLVSISIIGGIGCLDDSHRDQDGGNGHEYFAENSVVYVAARAIHSLAFK